MGELFGFGNLKARLFPETCTEICIKGSHHTKKNYIILGLEDIAPILSL